MKAQCVIRAIGFYLLHQIAGTVLTVWASWILAGLLYRMMRFTRLDYSGGVFEFYESHLIVMCLVVGMVAGALNTAKYNYRHVASWVWAIPTAVLLVHILTFSSYSVFDNRFQVLWDHYFGPACHPAYSTYELIYGDCYDQIFLTAPWLASVSYAFGAFMLPKGKLLARQLLPK